jgi:ATP-dependent helicase/nuclease subunit B
VSVNREGKYVGDALATAEQLGHLSAYVDSLLTGMARELRAGSIAADPWYRSAGENTCLYCDYRNACHFDESRDAWRYPSGLKAPEFWARIDPDSRTEGGGQP